MTSPTESRPPRVDYCVPVVLGGAARVVPAHTLNVSERGLFVGTAAALDVGEVITCQLPLQGQTTTLRGRVAWRRGLTAGELAPTGAGIELLDLSLHDVELLREIVGVPARRASWVAFDCDDYDAIEITSDVPSLVVSQVDDTERMELPARARRPRRWWLALAAAGLVAGVLAGRHLGADDDPAPVERIYSATPDPVPDPEPDPVPVPVPVPAPEPDPVPALAAPELTTSRGITEIVVPIDGSPDGARHYRLADPDGVAVNVPNARPRVQFGDFRINRDGVQTILVHERRGGLHVRVVFSHRTVGHSVEVGADAVRVRLQLD